ncbi:MAG TPA: hypothetical protein O0Y06_02475 [Methanocorpusculum sp.]|nr:hypothetical protein [Methanocorpusculum sp.]HJK79750.1 hypothetical protein [Methanocorpusculum sp.]
MRPEVLYEYDLPIEILDEIPADEEVLEVLYARSSENYHLPILITRLRIVCAYPETSVVYRVFQINYVDLMQVHVKFTRGLSTVLTFTRLDGEMNVFDRIRNKPEEVRAALLTFRDLMIEKVGGEWKFLHRQSLLTDEYMVKESDPVLSSVPTIPAEDLFEDKEMPGLGCYEPTEKLFEHFPPEAEDGDVFEEVPEIVPAVDAEVKSAAMNSRVQRMIETAESEAEEVEIAELTDASVDDATVLGDGPGVTDSQWANEEGGDAMILPEKRPHHRSPGGGTLAKLATEPLVPVDEDDSEVYVTPKPSPKKQKEEEAAAVIAEELDRLPVPKVKEPVKVSLPTPLPRASSAQMMPSAPPTEKTTIPMSITLEPQDSFEEETVDACLESLKLLRDTGVITEEEYKDRCLRLFKKNGA